MGLLTLTTIRMTNICVKMLVCYNSFGTLVHPPGSEDGEGCECCNQWFRHREERGSKKIEKSTA